MITLQGQPQSTNHVWKSTCRGGYAVVYISARGRELKDQYRLEVRHQWKGKERLQGELRAEMKLYFRDKRARDIDNYCKLVLDSMNEIVYNDDKQIRKLTIEKFLDRDNPRVEVEVSNYEVSS
jgi:Holliday junction resolvase RusA-like endonuclease